MSTKQNSVLDLFNQTFAPTLLASSPSDWENLQLINARSALFYFPEHTKQNHTLCVNTGNSITIERKVDGYAQTIDSVPYGDIGFYPAHLRQEFYTPHVGECIQLFLKPELIDQAEQELALPTKITLEPKLTPGIDTLVYQIALALKTSLEIDGTASKLYADSMANALAVHLLTHYSNYHTLLSQPAGKLAQSQLQPVLDYIHSHLEQDIGLADLAKLTGLSTYHFSRLFKQSIGLAPHQYHLRCRVDRAKQLLLDRHLSLADIALAVGFGSQAHFNYQFKRWVGTTPTAFFRQQ